MNFTTIGSIFDEAENEFEPQEMKEPVEFIGNLPIQKVANAKTLLLKQQLFLKNMVGEMNMPCIIIRIRLK